MSVEKTINDKQAINPAAAKTDFNGGEVNKLLCLSRFFSALSLVGILPVARAELATFTVDPALSSVTRVRRAMQAFSAGRQNTTP